MALSYLATTDDDYVLVDLSLEDTSEWLGDIRADDVPYDRDTERALYNWYSSDTHKGVRFQSE